MRSFTGKTQSRKLFFTQFSLQFPSAPKYDCFKRRCRLQNSCGRKKITIRPVGNFAYEFTNDTQNNAKIHIQWQPLISDECAQMYLWQVSEEYIFGMCSYGSFPFSWIHIRTHHNRGENKAMLIEFDSSLSLCVLNALEPLLSHRSYARTIQKRI